MDEATIAAYKKYMLKHCHIFKRIAKVYSFQNMEGVYNKISAIPNIDDPKLDTFITNPFFDETNFDEVDPFEHYDELAVISWMITCAARHGFNLHLDRYINQYTADQKRFMCVWGEGYRDNDSRKPKYQEVDILYFSDDLGYDEDMRERIDNLRVGEPFVVPDVTSIHSVVRIK